MKKVLVATILGFATVASTFAQGKINLDSYFSSTSFPIITQGSMMPSPGTAVNGYQVGFYFINGNVATGTDASGVALISSFAPTLTLATGVGSASLTGNGGFILGTGNDYTFTGLASGPATLIVVAWTGAATYDLATIRGHSATFQITPTQFGPGSYVGDAMINGFTVNPVPEPSTFALAGLGLAGLLIFRRRK